MTGAGKGGFQAPKVWVASMHLCEHHPPEPITRCQVFLDCPRLGMWSVQHPTSQSPPATLVPPIPHPFKSTSSPPAPRVTDLNGYCSEAGQQAVFCFQTEPEEASCQPPTFASEHPGGPAPPCSSILSSSPQFQVLQSLPCPNSGATL